jgi:hypothetical protein
MMAEDRDVHERPARAACFRFPLGDVRRAKQRDGGGWAVCGLDSVASS